MKTGLYICALLFAVCSMAETTTDKPKPIQTGQGHTFACTDYSGKKVFIVDKNGNVEWEYVSVPPSTTC